MSLGRGRGRRKGIKIRTNRIDTIQNKRMHDTQSCAVAKYTLGEFHTDPVPLS